MKQTRLAQLCKVFNWQGGTIHQANEEASNCLERPIDALSLDDYEFQELIEELQREYRSWYLWSIEQERE